MYFMVLNVYNFLKS